MRTDEQLLVYIGGAEKLADPIRIMKGLFLFTQEAEAKKVAADSLFSFSPMSYGPCSSEIYGELDRLVGKGLISSSPVRGQTWRHYEATDAGQAAIREIEKHADKTAVEYLRRLREWCDDQTFSSLLRAVYKHYPAFAVNSVFRSPG